MKKVRAKFRVIEKKASHIGGEILFDIKLKPVTANNDPNSENSTFWKYTPSGIIELGVLNDEAASFFIPGKELYIDFSEAEVITKEEV